MKKILIIIAILLPIIIIICALYFTYKDLDIPLLITFFSPFLLLVIYNIKPFKEYVFDDDGPLLLSPPFIFVFLMIFNLSSIYFINKIFSKVIIITNEHEYCIDRAVNDEIYYFKDDKGQKDSIKIDNNYSYVYNKSLLKLTYYKIYYYPYYSFNKPNKDSYTTIKPNEILRIDKDVDYILKDAPGSVKTKKYKSEEVKKGISVLKDDDEINDIPY